LVVAVVESAVVEVGVVGRRVGVEVEIEVEVELLSSLLPCSRSSLLSFGLSWSRWWLLSWSQLSSSGRSGGHGRRDPGRRRCRVIDVALALARLALAASLNDTIVARVGGREGAEEDGASEWSRLVLGVVVVAGVVFAVVGDLWSWLLSWFKLQS